MGEYSMIDLDTDLNRFVDRDMLMRYTGLGVGHRMTHESTQKFRANIQEATDIEDDEDT